MVVLITVQANIPSIVFLGEQGYQPPERVIGAVSGVGTVAGSLLGPTGVSLSLPATALSAGPDAGEHSIRYRTVVIVCIAAIAVALLSGWVVQLAAAIPGALLVTGVGLAVIGVLSNALQRATSGPLIWGPLFAFGIALSDISLVGLGPFFWAIAGGIGVSLLLEREQLKMLHDGRAV
jgi:benzoate membrane transport protein